MSAGRKINFDLINARARERLESLLGEWLPDGKKSGGEYKALNPTRSDTKPGSFSINLDSGAWADFATGDKGGDPVSLYAYLNGLSQKDAALALAAQLGIDDAPAPAVSAVAAPAKKKPRTDFAPILPVPDDAPPPPKAHVRRGLPACVWRYADASGALLGYVYRFTTSDGGKEILPLTFCAHAVTGEREWRWVSWPVPRPLYGLDRLRDGKPVLLVEGEKCADAAWDVPEIRAAFDVLTWPGGSKAVDKADWSPLAKRDAVIWPDCDAQSDKQGALKPEAEQPGVIAAEQIAQRLLALGCKVYIAKIPAPGEKPGGWDVADAIAEGWDGARLLAFLRGNLRPPAQAVIADASVPRAVGDGWQDDLIRKRGEVAACVANVFDILMHDKRWAGVLAFDEFSQRTMKMKPPPYDGGAVGEWEALDDTMTAMALSRNFDFTPSSAMIAEAVEACARRHAYHPVRDWLRGLAWDGEGRLDDWMSDFLGVSKTLYSICAGRWFLMGMVARVMRPGVKFDYCLVLEGPQGRGKSTALSILGGEWFGDTDLDLANKDSMSALRGKWLYEFAELGSITRSEASKQKSFLTRLVDEFRPVYGRREIRCPRQTVFGGTTNEWEWNKDPTGGRRFWPVEVGDMNLDGLRNARDQLFAEALARFDNGERFYPTLKEQRELFDPEQLKREQQESLIDALHDWVFGMTREFSIAEAAHDGLKADASKMTRDFTTRIGIALRKLGCARVEKRNGMTRYWYKPPVRNEATSSVGAHIEGADHVPF